MDILHRLARGQTSAEERQSASAGASSHACGPSHCSWTAADDRHLRRTLSRTLANALISCAAVSVSSAFFFDDMVGPSTEPPSRLHPYCPTPVHVWGSTGGTKATTRVPVTFAREITTRFFFRGLCAAVRAAPRFARRRAPPLRAPWMRGPRPRAGKSRPTMYVFAAGASPASRVPSSSALHRPPHSPASRTPSPPCTMRYGPRRSGRLGVQARGDPLLPGQNACSEGLGLCPGAIKACPGC